MGWAKQQHEYTSIITETERRSAHLHGGWVTDLQHCLLWADITFCAADSAVHSSIYIRCWATPKLSSMRQTYGSHRLPCCVKHHNCISSPARIFIHWPCKCECTKWQDYSWCTRTMNVWTSTAFWVCGAVGFAVKRAAQVGRRRNKKSRTFSLA